MKLLKGLTHPINLLVAIMALAIYMNRDVFVDGGVATASAVTEQPPVDTPPAPAVAAAPRPVPVTRTASAPPMTESTERTAPIAPDPMAEQEPERAAEQPDTEVDGAEIADAESHRELWRDARLAAWQGDLERSEALYRAFAEARPEDVDAYGELGNVLMRQGDWNGAAQAYYEAAVRAGAREQMQTAWYLHSIVAGLDHELAVDLRHRLGAQ